MVKVKNDLTGQVFGRLTVMYQVEDYVTPKGRHHAKWHCVCLCKEHNEVDVTTACLISGNTKSCGCIKRYKDEKYDLTLEEKSYIYGLLLADGSFKLSNKRTHSGTVMLEVQEADMDIINKLVELIPYSTKGQRNRDTNFKTSYNSVSFRNSRSSFIRMLIDFGMPTQNKTINACPPIYEYDENAFWRGVIDGDGALGIRHRSNSNILEAYLSLTTKSEDLKNAFCKYLSSITGKTYNPQRNKRDDIYNIGTGGLNACKILKRIYQNSTIHLNRKYQRYIECLKWESENNKPKRNTSGVIGVCMPSKQKQWLATICVNKKNVCLGYFDNKEEAIKARLQAEYKYYGKFAKQAYLFEQYGIG